MFVTSAWGVHPLKQYGDSSDEATLLQVRDFLKDLASPGNLETPVSGDFVSPGFYAKRG